ncbi:hypothetical protein Hte_007741 [Hypoxylon texense]
MKTSISLVSVLLGICLTGVQADLPYNMPEWRRDASPPILPSPDHPYPTHHRPTGTTAHHYPTSVHLPGHHRPPPHATGGTGHAYPTGAPPHHHNHPPRDADHHTTLKTVTGTGGHAAPTGGPYSPPPRCKKHADCKSVVCPAIMPPQSPQCIQGRAGKYCACEAAKTQ